MAKMSIRGYVQYFNPTAFVAGFVTVYKDKGLDRLLADIRGMTIEKIQARYMFVVYAVISIIVAGMVGGMKGINKNIRTIIEVALFYIAGYNVAKFIDPEPGEVGYIDYGNRTYSSNQLTSGYSGGSGGSIDATYMGGNSNPYIR